MSYMKRILISEQGYRDRINRGLHGLQRLRRIDHDKALRVALRQA